MDTTNFQVTVTSVSPPTRTNGSCCRYIRAKHGGVLVDNGSLSCRCRKRAADLHLHRRDSRVPVLNGSLRCVHKMVNLRMFQLTNLHPENLAINYYRKYAKRTLIATSRMIPKNVLHCCEQNQHTAKDAAELVIYEHHVVKINKISLFSITVQIRIVEFRNNILTTPLFPLQFDESTNVTSYSQLLVFTWYIKQDRVNDDVADTVAIY